MILQPVASLLYFLKNLIYLHRWIIFSLLNLFSKVAIEKIAENSISKKLIKKINRRLVRICIRHTCSSVTNIIENKFQKGARMRIFTAESKHHCCVVMSDDVMTHSTKRKRNFAKNNLFVRRWWLLKDFLIIFRVN